MDRAPPSTGIIISFFIVLAFIASLWYIDCGDLSSLRLSTVTENKETSSDTEALIRSIGKSSSMSVSDLRELAKVLKKASRVNNTVIITPLNQAWARNGSMLDSLLESFHSGLNTSQYVNNLLMIALDKTAYERCTQIHPHCFQLQTGGVNFTEEKVFMSPDYLTMTSRKIHLLTIVLQMGYDFVFTDGDILWFRDPFQHFSPEADFEVSCDRFNGNEFDLNNALNTGFIHVRSNSRTVALYKLWHDYTKVFSGNHDQDVFNKIKYRNDFLSIGARIRFLPTRLFSGFCQRPDDLDSFSTMHANCCKGLQAKLQDLHLVMDDWDRYLRQTPNQRTSQRIHFRAPDTCRRSWS